MMSDVYLETSSLDGSKWEEGVGGFRDNFLFMFIFNLYKYHMLYYKNIYICNTLII